MEQSKIFEYLKQNPNTTYNEALCMIDALKESDKVVKIDLYKKADELNKENVYVALVNLVSGDLEFYHYNNFDVSTNCGHDFLVSNVTKIRIGINGFLKIYKEDQSYVEDEIFHYSLDVINISKEKFEAISENLNTYSKKCSELLYNEIFKRK